MGSSAADNLKLDFTTFYNVIDNSLTPTKHTRHAINPSTEEPLPEVPVSTQEDVDDAVRAGQEAFTAWKELSYEERAGYITKFTDAIEANLEGLTEMLGKEAGKPIPSAGMEFALVMGHLRETVKLRIPDEVVEDSEERTATIRYTPLGVGVGIIPWNFPILLAIGKLDAALLTGNTFIWKPSPYTPYTSLKIGELGAKIFPPGVLQVLSGNEDLGPKLTAHPGVAKISFTGSTATGKKVMQSCAATLKRVTLEMGGNDAAIVCEDVDIAAVIPKVSMLSFIHSGQICMVIKRVYVHEKIYDEFLEKMAAFVKNLKVAPAGDPEAMLGPIQNAMQFGKVKDLYNEIGRQGWQTVLGGLPDQQNRPAEKGFFMPPTIIANPPDDSRIVVEEPFGPIIPVLKWSDEKDVIRRANDTMMGLGASVWSSDIERASRMAKKLEAGSIWVNTHFELSPHMQFGGHKWSGMGVDWGVLGMKGWCNPQAFWVRKVIV
ncbi:aldehyde dehydrogenase domain-containing protein [Apodospora peruviana]|uniref:aldehyde dehydrogenase (NAD(+)) n=1 Tax=Apodospora peruviana TaxID=516989 RepID=A0AAE0HSI9_9PEZI|nr:aldehyde dehydrogenase domain-containing protein [Apodospora peruviana]